MKFKKFMTLAAAMCIICISAAAQRVTIDFRQVRLEQILDEISGQTGFSFYYSQPTVDPDAIFSISVKDMELPSALDKLFENTKITYDIAGGGKIYLIARTEVPETQNHTVKGRITDAQGMPVIGAAVVISGTTYGTSTDLDGNWSLDNVPQGTILEISSVGFQTEKMTVGKRAVLDITLHEDARLLDEVVVVGYGSQRRINLTGAVWASTQNKHGAPGFCTQSGDALFKLFRATGDTLYAGLLRDVIHAHAEGIQPNGKITERLTYCDADSRGSRGDGGKTGWNETNGALMALEIPGIYIRTDINRMYVFDHVRAKVTRRSATATWLEITNPTAYDACVTILKENGAQAGRPLGDNAFVGWNEKVTVRAGRTIRCKITHEK